MRRLILKMSMSLDGFVAGPHGEMDWMFRSRDEGGMRWVEETLRQAGLHVMGSRTYYDMAAFWPTANHPLAEPMNAIPKAVFTRQPSLDLGAGRTTQALNDANRAKGPDEEASAARSPHAASWAGAEVINGDLAAEIQRLKQQPGKDILAHGGADFAQSLAAAGLIDEYRLVVHPVVLGKGLSIFAKLPKPLDLELRSTTVFRSGTTALVYRPA
jgi:dihydrofolate reductase